MPLTGDFSALRTLIGSLRPHELRRPVVLGVQSQLPRLVAAAAEGRKTPSGGSWAPNKREARPLDRVTASLRFEASRERITCKSEHPGAGQLQYGTARQPPRHFLPMKGLPAGWSVVLRTEGTRRLKEFLRAD